MGVSNGFAAPPKLKPLDILGRVGMPWAGAAMSENAGVPGPPGLPISVAADQIGRGVARKTIPRRVVGRGGFTQGEPRPLNEQVLWEHQAGKVSSR